MVNQGLEPLLSGQNEPMAVLQPDTVAVAAGLLAQFFHDLRGRLQSQFGYACVDGRLPKRFVFSDEDCCAWFGDGGAGRGRRQQFGSFFDIGAGPYLFHVEVGTTNLHVGVVKARRNGGRVAITRMDEFDRARIEIRLNPWLPPDTRLAWRAWGHGWCSIDCGAIRNVDATRLKALLDLERGHLMAAVIAPLAAVLPEFARERAWAWLAFDRRQWFRFFVDGRFHRKYSGWRGYEENEAGSVQGMLNAFAFAIANLDRAADLDVPYLLELHRHCMDGVVSRNPKSTPGQVRFREAGFHFYAKNSTLASLAEVFELRRGDGTPIFHEPDYARSTDDIDYVEAYEGLQQKGKLRFRPWYPELGRSDRQAIEATDGSPRFLALKERIQAGFLARMQECIDTYKRVIAAAQRDVERIHAIARLARDLELLHPFPDGNGRAFPVALASQLLLYHDLPPPIYRDPNIDAELSYAEFAVETIAAMRNTLQLLRQPEATLFDYSIAEASAQEIDDFAAMSRELGARLDLLDARRGPEEIFATPDYLAWLGGGRWINYRPGLRFSNTGSHRTFGKGGLYFGLAVPEWRQDGKSIDAELDRVIAKGAAALVLDYPVARDRFPVPVLVVEDLAAMLKALAQRTRSDVGCKTVLVTGTEGKTGAKIQLHHLLRRQARVHAVLNSANTEGPVLFSLANLGRATEVEINEVSVGANEALRVERARLVAPDICLFTNIGPNHMDMHKTMENVIVAKSSVVAGLPPGGVAILNADNEYFPQMRDAIGRRRQDVTIKSYGLSADDDGRLLAAEFNADRLAWRVWASIGGHDVDYVVPMPQNFAPLASVGVLLAVHQLGYDVAVAAADYAGFRPYETMGRTLRLHLEGGDALFYDQSRRGGLHGMRAAFRDLDQFKAARRVVALVGGISIKKDGEWTRQAHAELAQLINASRIERLYTTGNYMDYVHAALQRPEILIAHSDDIESLADALVGELRPGDLLFMIGSAYLYLGRVSDIVLKRLRHSLAQTTEPAP